MEVIGALFLLVLGGALGAGAAWQYMQAHRSAREITLDAQLQALQAMRALSLEAWRARQALHGLHLVHTDPSDDAA
ncbi:MAG: hypothetical protein DHS20C19_24060 [Acidimicrobiales bacterium]|nr:MAG: hypothetical protein DHS20C19_24060 [Acidimicrobiales bacterium]